MRADSWRARSQGSTSSHGGGTAFGCALALCAVLGTAGCTKANFSGDAGGTPDGGKKDAKTSDVAPPGTCPPGTVSASKGRAESCTCNAECQTGFFCADGLCCTSACGQTCKACNLASSLGECNFVPSDQKPHDPSVCTASTPATCGQDGFCDGKGGCHKYGEGTPCKAGICNGDGITGVLTCDGNGKCSEPGSPPPCPPWTCDPATSSCTNTCTTNSQCAAGVQCVAGRCGKSINGAVCRSSDDCLSTFCVGASAGELGVCCNIACGDACWSCNQTGLVGTCTALPALWHDSACKATDPTACGNNGLCDGLGSCTLYPENTVCGPSSCSGLMENTPRTCDGKGTCRDPGITDCSPFLCTGVACATICKTDADCETGHQCVSQTIGGVTSGTCGKKKPGQLCGDATECESSQCVDGVCCESACAGPCLACNLPSSPGQCLKVAAGASDPRDTCKDLGPALCSTNGLCDGTGACQSYPAGTVCSSQSCVAGSYTQPGTCNASGQCTAASRTCNPYVCNGSVCYAACTDSTQCVTGNVCTASSCGLKPLGASCSLGKDCASSFCAQGVCCENACTGACMACNLATPGLCVSVPDNSSDPQGKCTSTTQTNPCGSTGKCVGGACAYVPKGQNCKASSCSGASETPGSQCDGQGTCGTPASIDCTPFACVNNVCKNSCTVATQATDCTSPATCANNTCGLKPLGAACTAAAQCQSGFCTEGVCCNNACSDGSPGLCKTCKGTSTSVAGTCSYVDKGGSDPKSGCTKSDLSKGDCSNAGTCDGAGACQRQPNTAGCRQNSCTAGVQTLAANCNGGTQCPAVQTDKCDPFVCGLTACLMTCKANSDCNGVTCNVTTNNCGEKLADGKQCSIDTDCTNGHCIGGICCHTTCAACQSCSSVGTCTNIKAGGAPLTNCGTKAASGACGNNGTCDGSGNCAQNATCNASFTTCKDVNTQYDPKGNCDYSGSTPACDLVADDCGAYVCSGMACKASCASDADCDTASSNYCMGTTCRTLNAGEACSSSKKCPSSLTCVDGVCCNSKCGDVCMACNLSGHLGACTSVKSAPDNDTCPASCTGGNQYVSGCDSTGKCAAAVACPNSTVCGSITTCGTVKELGATCAAGTDCQSGNCVSGANGKICCMQTTCDDGKSCTTDACTSDGTSCTNTIAATSCVIGGTCYAAGATDPNNQCQQCTPATSQTGWTLKTGGTICRAANGACDVAEVCDGTSAACPADGVAASTTVCRAANGVCDVAENCDGTAKTCPADGVAAATTVCRTAKGACDVVENCDGTTKTCPADAVVAPGTKCRDAADLCDVAATCTGSATCPANGIALSSKVCRPAVSGGCDLAENCTGSDPNCPPDLTKAPGASCGTTVCPDGQSSMTTYACDNHATCQATITPCTSGYCSGGTCGSAKNNGSPCGGSAECSSGHCVSDGANNICCIDSCSGSTCYKNLCNSGGTGCQYDDNAACGSPCATDTHYSQSGTCSSGSCQETSVACNLGYLCVAGKGGCVTPGNCTFDSDCDVGAGYTCQTTDGTCQLTGH